MRQRVAQHRAPVERVGSLAGIDLDIRGQQFQPLGGDEPSDGLALRLEPQIALALLLGAHPDVGNPFGIMGSVAFLERRGGRRTIAVLALVTIRVMQGATHGDSVLD